jgi:Ca2+-binding RTX toxin-like protein
MRNMSDRWIVDLGNLAADEGARFFGNGDMGYSVSSAGDINGDGFDDFIVGAPGGNVSGGEGGSGLVYVIFGDADGFPSTFLSTIAQAQGFVIIGDAAGDSVGIAVSAAGDVNGDGFADVIVGADRGDNGGSGAGEAYVIYGHSGDFEDLDLSLIQPGQGFIIQGDAAGDSAGFSVSSAGDVNGDGIDDVIVGAPDGDDGGSLAGEAYVIFGDADGLSNIDLSALEPEQGFIIQGDAAGDSAGFSVSNAGDVNGDGIDDLVVGASRNDSGGNEAGEAYVIFGHVGAHSNLDLTTLGPTQGFVISGSQTNMRVGESVSGAGDVNGDGIEDLIVGSNHGAYLILGHEGEFTNIDLLPSGGAAIYLGIGGDAVSRAGDVNGDGFADLIIGNSDSSAGSFESGAAYIVFGWANIGSEPIPPEQLVTLFREEKRQYIGGSVSAAGDINGDGFDDVIIGSREDWYSGRGGNQAYVVFGAPSLGVLHRTGTDGADTIEGTAVDEVIDGLAGADVISGDAGDDAIYGSPGSDDLSGGDGDDLLDGGGNGDILSGGEGHDHLIGYRGNDVLRGGLGDDLLDGGEDTDTASYRNASVGVLVRLDGQAHDTGVGIDTLVNVENILGSDHADRLVGSEVVNKLEGKSGDDDLRGLAGNDRLVGGAGDDLLRGGLGLDTMEGGLGDDTYWVDQSQDVAKENPDEGRDLVIAEVSYTLRAHIEELNLDGAGNIDGTGNNRANIVRGNAGDNVLSGLGGTDVLNGRDGDDTLDGGEGADTMDGGNGDDFYYVDDAGDAVIEGGDGGIDTVRSTIDYVLLAPLENLELAGAATSGTGNKRDNAILGKGSDDTLAGLGGNDTLSGDTGRDTLTGGNGDDTLLGGVGNDTLSGESDNDVLEGGAGKDELSGGGGLDRFVFRDGDVAFSRSVADTVADFRQSQGDLIVLEAMDANTIQAGDQKFRFIGTGEFTGAARELHYVHDGGDTFVEGDTDGDGEADFTIRLTGTVDLTVADFVL